MEFRTTKFFSQGVPFCCYFEIYQYNPPYKNICLTVTHMTCDMQSEPNPTRLCSCSYIKPSQRPSACRQCLKCDGTRAETIFRLSAKRTSPFKSAGGGRQFSRLLAAEACASAVVMLDTSCSEVVWSVLATHYIHQFPLHFLLRASPCDITFQLQSTTQHRTHF